MKLTLQIQSTKTKTLVLCHDVDAEKDVHRAEGWGATEGMADIIAIDDAIECLRRHRRQLLEGKEKTILASLMALHGAVASELATRTDWRNSYRGLYDAMKSAEWFIDKLNR